MKRWLLAAISLALCAVCVWLGANASQNAAIAWGAAVVFLICFIVCITRKGKAGNTQRKKGEAQSPAPAPAPPARQPYAFVAFNVAGTTFQTDGVSRQSLLRKIKFSDPPFENGDALDIALHPSTFNGSPCIECLVNNQLIGFVPKEQVEEVAQAIKRKGACISAFEVSGGGTVDGERINYGAHVVVRYEI